MIFPLECDLFASKYNNKWYKCVCISDDQGAFSAVWATGLYIFPPIPLLARVVCKLQRNKSGPFLVITPAWDSLSVLPIIESTLIASPILIHSYLVTGCHLTRQPFHWMVWSISEKSVKKFLFQGVTGKPSFKVLQDLP